MGTESAGPAGNTAGPGAGASARGGAQPPGRVPAWAAPEETAPEGTAPQEAAGVRTGGWAGLSRAGRSVVTVIAALVALAVAAHLALVFLHVAPRNTLSEQHAETLDAYVYPEFEQNWKLFAPNPLQQNIAVHARAEYLGGDGRPHTTGWVDLSAQDGARIRGNLLPSHVDQNELRRAWDFLVGSHDEDERPLGLRGELSERYVSRIALLRLAPRLAEADGLVRRVQVRSATTRVQPPAWSDEEVERGTEYRVMPWWKVTPDDVPAGDTREGGAR